VDERETEGAEVDDDRSDEGTIFMDWVGWVPVPVSK